MLTNRTQSLRKYLIVVLKKGEIIFTAVLNRLYFSLCRIAYKNTFSTFDFTGKEENSGTVQTAFFYGAPCVCANCWHANVLRPIWERSRSGALRQGHRNAVPPR